MSLDTRPLAVEIGAAAQIAEQVGCTAQYVCRILKEIAIETGSDHRVVTRTGQVRIVSLAAKDKARSEAVALLNTGMKPADIIVSDTVPRTYPPTPQKRNRRPMVEIGGGHGKGNPMETMIKTTLPHPRPPTTTGREMLAELQAVRREIAAVRKLLDHFAGVLLNARFPYGKATDRWARR